MKKQTKQSILTKIIIWLYTNDKEYESRKEWKEALINYLETILK